MTEERKKFTDEIIAGFRNGAKEFFFTGLKSIGKTFTLLIFNFIKQNSIKTTYFNLEALNKEKDFIKIIIYESQTLFDNKEDWKDAFVLLKNKINDSKNFLRIILNLIQLLANKYMKKGIEYIIILDQIKFKKIEDNVYKDICSIREIVQNTKNLYLIGCCSLNYKGVKEILFFNFSKTKESPNINKIPKLIYINSSKFADKKENQVSNKYLNLFGDNLRFRNIENKLNPKIINLFLKKTKEKLLKFYVTHEFIQFEKIENIPVLNNFKQTTDFLDELNKIPFKYFEIFEKKNMFDFSCPLIKLVF